MNQKKVTDLARSCSLACQKLVKDPHMLRSLTPPAVVLVSLTVTNLLTKIPFKNGWGD